MGTIFISLDLAGARVICLITWRRSLALARSRQKRSPSRHALNRTRAAVTVLFVLFLMADVGMQSGALQSATLACPFTDEAVYEGAQGCFDNPSENDDPAPLASVPSGAMNPFGIPLTSYSLLYQFASIQNSHQLTFVLRC